MAKLKISVSCGRSTIVYPKISKFPGGEVLVKLGDILKPEYNPEECRIEALLTNSDDILVLVMLVDAIREYGYTKIHLTMPYVPYARQDRVCDKGEALSIRAFAKIINSLDFSTVEIWDPHSDVTPALIDRCIVKPRKELMTQHYEAQRYIRNSNNVPVYLVSPDAGSVKKSYEIAKHFWQLKGIIFADKVRDVATGNILKTSVSNIPDDIKEAKLLICDDICDGGRTFIELGKVLAEYQPKEMSLYVTHGIFSQGKCVLLKNTLTADECMTPDQTGQNLNSGVFDNVWCSVDFLEYK